MTRVGTRSWALLLAFWTACANPRPPTGGPADQTPPTIDASVPAPGALNVGGHTVRITFSEFVDPATLPRALSISPAVDGTLDFRWRRRTVEIRFPETFRDSTTYVLTLDANLRDAHGVALRQPLTLAFSTGSIINQGRLAGHVVDANRGRGVPGIDVYAYAHNSDTPLSALPNTPDYRTQTDDAGRFNFEYLKEQGYFVVALRDQNRNRRLDETEPFAVPLRPVVQTQSSQTDSLRWFLTTRDAIPPRVQRVSPLTERRVALRFSEPVRLTLDDSTWTLADSSTGDVVPFDAVYQPAGDPRQLILLTPLLMPRPHRLHPAAVADTSNNVLPDTTLFFTPSSSPDTVRLRFLGFVPIDNTGDTLSVLSPGTAPGVRFNEPVSTQQANTLITASDTTGQPRAFSIRSTDGVTLTLHFEPPLPLGMAVRLTISGPALGTDSTYAHTFRRMDDSDLGTLSGVVFSRGSAPIVVELYREGQNAPVAQRPVATDGRFAFSNLPEDRYRFRLFMDYNQNGAWDSGSLLPYSSPEPLTWADAPAWRARWDTALADTLRLIPASRPGEE